MRSKKSRRDDRKSPTDLSVGKMDENQSSPVRDDRKPFDIPHDRILRNREIKSVGLLSPLWGFRPLQTSLPSVETVGYSRTSLPDSIT